MPPDPDESDLGFDALGLDPALLRALSDLGYEEPTPIQREAIPVLLGGADLLGQAATGTGKTAAFALPILHAIGRDAPVVPTALVLVPTRELAIQVSEALFKYGRELGIKVLPVFGGQPIQRQLRELSRGVHVVVATPGRALDHIQRKSLDLSTIRTVVLDEADEMLDMGFSEDLEAILDETPAERQTVLFSATIPKRITTIAKRYQRDPVRIELGKASTDRDDESLLREVVYWVQRAHKANALGRVLDIEVPNATIVFCRTRTEVDELTATMNGRGYRAEAIHGGMDQNQRDRVMGRLRDGSVELLVATDVAARGLDVDLLTHVVNYDVPSAPESYVHRTGRVGRAGREGVAITLAEPRQRRLLDNIERYIKRSIPVNTVPTVADLRSKQIELTVDALNEALTAEDLDDYHGVLNELGGEDQRRIALAAIKLVHEARSVAGDEREIPDASAARNRDRGGPQRGGGRQRDGRPKGQGGKGAPRPSRGADGDTGFIYVSAGAKSGVRPADLVGAVANESGLTGRDIGPIRISEHHSVVGVPAASVDDVVRAMAGATVRGKPAKVRRYTE